MIRSTVQKYITNALRVVILVPLILIVNAAESPRTLTFGTGTFPPNSYIDPKTGECIGHSIDAVKNILANYNFKVNVVCASAKRIYRMIENGDIDLTLNTANPKLLKDVVTVVSPPYRYLKITLYHNPDIEENNLVSAVRGFNYNGHRAELVENGFLFSDLLNTNASLRFFLKGRTSHLLSYREPIEHALKEKNIQFNESVIEDDIGAIPTHFAITNNSPIYSEIDQALKDYIKANGIEYFMEQAKTR
jgi:polar amino acid transport system substrate-binding protein